VKSRRGTILFPVWKEGRAAAKQGLYRGVSKLKPPHAKKESVNEGWRKYRDPKLPAIPQTDHQLQIAIDIVKNRHKGMKSTRGHSSPEEAEKKLRTKYKYTDKMIAKLKKEDKLDEAPKLKSFKEYSDAFEALTISQRQKRKAAFRKNKAKIMIARKKAAKKLASPEKLKQRAIVQARNIIIKKILKNKGKAELSFAAKAELEKKVKKKTGAIKKIAKKILPQIKQAEKARLKNRKTPDQ
jgi:hypothetical protein